jgi:hypothetical protein
MPVAAGLSDFLAAMQGSAVRNSNAASTAKVHNFMAENCFSAL